MAKKSDILKCTKTIAQFLGNSERPSKLGLAVDNLSTLNRTAKAVEFSRKDLRSFAKVILTERQNYGEGLYILKDVNVKKLKDSQLGELFAATNPNGVSKYYTTIRRMTYSNILAVALEEQVEAEPKVAKAKKVKAKKPKASTTKKPKVSKQAKELFNEEGNLKPFTPSKGKKLKTARKPKVSKVPKVYVSKETVELTATIGKKNQTITMLKHDWESTNREHWINQCIELGLPSVSKSKKEMAVMVGVYNSIMA